MITIERKKLEMVLEALTYKKWFRIGMVEQNDPRVEAAITAIKEALAQPAQEPVGHRVGFWCAALTCNKCYSAEFRFKHTTPQQEQQSCDRRPWVGLTDEDLEFWTGELGQGELGKGVIRAVSDHLKDKNT
jgi:hypothetical protein